MPNSFLKTYRFEDFIEQLDAFMKANLNAYIAQMNTDKTDISLATLDSTAWYFQSLTDTEVVFDPFVFYGETGTQTVVNGPDNATRFTLQVAIILGNRNDAAGIMGKRLLRYRDCLRAMFYQGWNTVNKRVKLEVQDMSPFPFALVNTEPTHMGIGVTVQVDLA